MSQAGGQGRGGKSGQGRKQAGGQEWSRGRGGDAEGRGGDAECSHVRLFVEWNGAEWLFDGWALCVSSVPKRQCAMKRNGMEQCAEHGGAERCRPCPARADPALPLRNGCPPAC